MKKNVKNNFQELSYKELTQNLCDPKKLGFKTTKELEGTDTVIGQERARKAMDFGMNVKMKGYNIYIAGDSGCGKTTYTRSFINKIAQEEKTPSDWCYVYNFEKESNPEVLEFPVGMGKVFRDDMEDFIKVFLEEIKKAFDTDEYEKERTEVLIKYQEKRDQLMKEVTKHAKERGFSVKMSNAGIYFMPIVNGEVISEEKYEQLSEEQKEEINTASEQIQMEATELLRDVKDIEKESKKKEEELDYKIGLFAVGHHINELKEKYKKINKVNMYLDKVQEDILKNIQQFVEDTDDEEQQQQPNIIQIGGNRTKDDLTLKYKVNLFVDNEKTKGAPVIIDFNPTYYKLIGQVQYDNEMGNLTTDFTKIKAGLLHQANGGYLVLQMSDLAQNSYSWEALKRVLKTNEITIENLREHQGAIAISSLKPEPIKSNVKVILIGNDHLYHVLYEYDEDFRKLFKIKVDFDNSIAKTDENIDLIAKFVKSFCDKNKTLHFDNYAVAKVIEYASRLVEDQTKLSARINEIAEILIESNAWAQIAKCKLVKAEHVHTAIYEKEQRSNLYEEKLEEMINDNVLMIDTEGEKIGQINGLAVLDTGDYTFGKPTRITATTYMGKAGIVNIEKEANMSGKIHNKGVQVLCGYLGQKYAQDMQLSLSCRISFEQNYSGIDGDSASSTELYAILSSLAEAPIKQGLAVTGSINQWGEIQPIGGVCHKVEGFFKLCKERGLTGDQGVVIPYQNVKELVLKEEVIEAVKKGEFHIYPIKHIEQGIEILTDVKAGEKDDQGEYDQDSINARVHNKLKKFNKNKDSKKQEN